jgi:hypothetical protein
MHFQPFRDWIIGEAQKTAVEIDSVLEALKARLTHEPLR